MEEEIQKLKMAVIAGAAQALRFKDKNPKALEQEIIQHITNNAEEILNGIDEDI